MVAEKKPGFTLVELLISLAILTLLSGSMFYVFRFELRHWERIVQKSENQHIANLVLTKLAGDIRAAKEILPVSDQAELILACPAHTIEYTLLNQKVRRKKDAYSSYLTDAGEVRDLTFSYPSNNLVEISLDGFKARFYLRNTL